MDLMLFIDEYKNIIMFGILMNLIFTVGFGIYKSMNLDSKQMSYLMDKYKTKNNPVKILAYWFLPFFGYAMVLKDILLLQKYLKNGFSVFDYVEDRLKKEKA